MAIYHICDRSDFINNIKILVANSDKTYVSIVSSAISNITKNISQCYTIENTFELLNEIYDFVITDYKFFNKDFTLRSIIEAYPKTEFIIVASNPSYSEGFLSMSNGARIYLDLKDELDQISNKILEIFSEKKNNAKLKEKLLNNYLLESTSESYNKMLSHCEKVAKTKANILLTGESGTGKEVAAKYIHLCSPRSTNNFIPINCSAFTETLLESELFGHEQGSFTGAMKSKQGRFEYANNGTLFLDEVGDINLTTQVKLLRVLETKKVERLGSNTERLIDFRLISATNKDLLCAVVNDKFREDFFYRISTIVINIPPLRERRDDLDKLIKFFLEKSQEENNIKIKHIEPEAEKFLYSYNYPGNIRELKSIVDRMVILSVNGNITKDGIPILYNIKNKENKFCKDTSDFNEIISFKNFKIESESKYLEWVLSQTGGNVAEAARKLDISARQLFNKIKEYNIKKS